MTTGLGHQFRAKERRYQDWARKLDELVTEMERESDPKDHFEMSMLKKLRDQVTNCELAASIELENYRDRS